MFILFLYNNPCYLHDMTKQLLVISYSSHHKKLHSKQTRSLAPLRRPCSAVDVSKCLSLLMAGIETYCSSLFRSDTLEDVLIWILNAHRTRVPWHAKHIDYRWLSLYNVAFNNFIMLLVRHICPANGKIGAMKRDLW